MQTIRRSFVAALALVITLTAAAATNAATYDVDANHHSVTFKIKHLGLSFIHGRFSDLTGTVNYDEKSPEKTTFVLAVPARTVNTANEKRDAHLRTADFFDVEKFPEISFRSTSVKRDGDDKDELEVTGELTLKGVTRTVKIEMKRKGPNKDGHIGFTTELEINRSDYNMSYGTPNNIGDKVKLEISFEAVPKK